MINEIPLTGGRSTQGIVKIGNTVHRSLNNNSDFTHKLLQLLEEKNYQYSPRFLGLDDQNREILTFIEGDLARGNKNWDDENLVEVVKMIKEFHDATEGDKLAGDKEVVCHNDLAPWNTVLRDGKPIAFIDFDDCAPGYRIDDFAYFLWTFLELGTNTSIDEQARKIKILTQAYGLFNIVDVVEAILVQQKRILEKRMFLSQYADTEEERKFSKEKVNDIRLEIDWVQRNRKIIEKGDTLGC